MPAVKERGAQGHDAALVDGPGPARRMDGNDNNGKFRRERGGMTRKSLGKVLPLVALVLSAIALRFGIRELDRLVGPGHFFETARPVAMVVLGVGGLFWSICELRRVMGGDCLPAAGTEAIERFSGDNAWVKREFWGSFALLALGVLVVTVVMFWLIGLAEADVRFMAQAA